MLDFRIQCVHCGANLSRVEHNTEHILDLNMGGLNTLENKTLICKKCNFARSRLKQELFGNTPEITMWNFIEKYIIWSFITLDYGHRAGMWFPEIHMTFLKFANGGREFEQSGNRYFARASDKRPTVLEQGSTHSAPAQKTKTPFTTSPPFLTRFSQGLARWLKGSDHDHLNRPSPQQPSTTPNVTNSEPERRTATKSLSKQQNQPPVDTGSPKQEAADPKSQRKALAKVIKTVFTEAMTASTLSTKIMKQWSKDHGTKFKSWKELVSHFEFDTSNDLGSIIRTLLGVKSISSKKGPSGEFLLVPKFGKKSANKQNPNKQNSDTTTPAKVKKNGANIVGLNTGTPEGFVQFMKNILTYVPQSLDDIGVQIEEYLVEQNSPQTSTSHFLSLHGIPKGLKKAIETHLGDEVEITGETPQYYVSLKREPPKFPDVDPEFQRHVLTALDNNDSELLLSAVSPILSTYLESIGLEKKSFKQFAKSYGIPLARTSVEIIHHYFRGSIAYRKEGKTVVYIWLVK